MSIPYRVIMDRTAIFIQLSLFGLIFFKTMQVNTDPIFIQCPDLIKYIKKPSFICRIGNGWTDNM